MSHYGNNLVLGTTGSGKKIVLQAERRLHHLSCFGLTGTGKSRWLESLVRSDLRAWPTSRCGLLLIDPHGSIFDGIMSWVAATGRNHLPIVPIDFRRSQQVVSYNILRQRSTEPSVIIDTFVRAMAFVWGKSDTDETPLFERWATNSLHHLYDEKKTLADAVNLFNADGMVATEHVRDPMVRRDWMWARRNRKEFETATSSSVNRFRRFLLNPTLRAMFGQTGASLDLGKALQDGRIVLVNLARKGGTISRENADLFATLLLSDLWAAAEERGKSDSVKPYYVFLDEFSRFLSPTMAENLAEARGFGLGLTIATQTPRQILNGGPHGQRIYDEIMENTRSKVVFQLRTRANLLPVAESLFMNGFDPDAMKHQHYSTKVLGHRLTYLPSFGTNSSNSVGGGEQQSHTKGHSHSVANTWSHTDSETHTLESSESHTDSLTLGASFGSGETTSAGLSEADQWTEGRSDSSTNGSNWNDSSGQMNGGGGNRSRSANVSQDLGEPTDELKRRLIRGGRRPDYHSLVESSDGYGKHQLYLDDATKRVNVSETLATSDSNTWAESTGRLRGGNRSNSHQTSLSTGGSTGRNESLAQSRNDQLSLSSGSADTFGTSESISDGTSDSYGGSETVGTNESDTTGTSSQWSTSTGSSRTWSPMLLPLLGKEADAPLFRTIDEQVFISMMNIARLRDREAYVLTADMVTPELIRTPDVNRPDISSTCTDLCIAWYQKNSGICLPLQEALGRVVARDKPIKVVVAAMAADAEFEKPRSRIVKSTQWPPKKT